MIKKEQIKVLKSYRTSSVAIPEWGGEITIRSLSVANELAFDDLVAKNTPKIDLAIFLILKSCIDDKGEYYFDENDVEFLKEQPSDVFLGMYNEIIKLNNKLPNSTEELAKN